MKTFRITVSYSLLICVNNRKQLEVRIGNLELPPSYVADTFEVLKVEETKE